MKESPGDMHIFDEIESFLQHARRGKWLKKYGVLVPSLIKEVFSCYYKKSVPDEDIEHTVCSVRSLIEQIDILAIMYSIVGPLEKISQEMWASDKSSEEDFGQVFSDMLAGNEEGLLPLEKLDVLLGQLEAREHEIQDLLCISKEDLESMLQIQHEINLGVYYMIISLGQGKNSDPLFLETQKLLKEYVACWFSWSGSPESIVVKEEEELTMEKLKDALEQFGATLKEMVAIEDVHSLLYTISQSRSIPMSLETSLFLRTNRQAYLDVIMQYCGFND